MVPLGNDRKNDWNFNVWPLMKFQGIRNVLFVIDFEFFWVLVRAEQRKMAAVGKRTKNSRRANQQRPTAWGSLISLSLSYFSFLFCQTEGRRKRKKRRGKRRTSSATSAITYGDGLHHYIWDSKKRDSKGVKERRKKGKIFLFLFCFKESIRKKVASELKEMKTVI